MKIPLFCLTNENKFFDINTILLFTKTLSISEKIKKKIYVIFYSIFFFFWSSIFTLILNVYGINIIMLY